MERFRAARELRSHESRSSRRFSLELRYRRDTREACAALAFAGCGLLSNHALALEPGTIFEEPVRVDVTETFTLLYNADNRDSKPHQVPTVSNDNWGALYNRLNVQASAGNVQLGLRLDNAWFYTARSPADVALELVELRPSDSAQPLPAYFRAKIDEAGNELSNRYINWLYPAKYYLGYSTRKVELTVGDTSAQFGRGFVLSVRKMDEIGSDTTIRGARVTLHRKAGEVNFRVSALGGSMNPLRVDAATGRYLGVHSSVTPSWLALTEAGMPRAVPTDFVAEAADCAGHGTCSYAPDRLAAGQVELEWKAVRMGTQASFLARQQPLSDDVVRSARQIITASQSVELLQLGESGALYVEAALQKLGNPDKGTELEAGHALYSSLNYAFGKANLLLEGKHYRRFFPLYANVSVARSREFNLIAYNAPPTTEAQWVDTEYEGFNTCVSGGRAKLDVVLSERVTAFGWVGHYQTFAESVANERCEISDDRRNDVWDTASGFIILGPDRRAKTNLLVGARVDDTAQPRPTFEGETGVFYRELYARLDAVYPLSGPYSLELHGWHRRRRLTAFGPREPWFEGMQILSLNFAPSLSLALGFEYDTNPQTPDTYYNAQFTYRVTRASSVALFGGQRRGALRCVAGVCRIFPPFEGAQLEVTARF